MHGPSHVEGAHLLGQVSHSVQQSVCCTRASLNRWRQAALRVTCSRRHGQLWTCFR